MPVSARMYSVAKAVLSGHSDELPTGIASIIASEWDKQNLGGEGTKKKKKTTATDGGDGGAGGSGGSVLPSNPGTDRGGRPKP